MEACGSTTTTIARYVATLEIKPVGQSAGFTAYARADPLRVVETYINLINVTEVASMLGIHINYTFDLIKDGFVKPDPFADRVGATHRRFSRVDLEAWIDLIAGDATLHGRRAEGAEAALQFVRRHWNGRNWSHHYGDSRR